MKFTKLFKKSSTGALLEWTIEVDGNQYRTHAGQVGGVITTSDWTTCEAKNVGRSNETSPTDQAILEATAKHKKQFDKGYSDDLSKVESGKVHDVIFPMLANDYSKLKKPLQFPVLTQPKYDGIRCILSKDWCRTRNGKDIVAVDHIKEIIAPVFNMLPDLILDGELYNHDLREDFNEITSIVKKSKLTSEDMDKSRNVIKYYVYDIIVDLPTTQRQKSLKFILNETFPDLQKYVVIVPTDHINNQEELDLVYDRYLSDGYEGQMIRNPETKYENKRSKSLLKRKEFQDDEFKIIDVLPGKGNKSDMAAKLIIQSLDGKMECESSIKGTHSFCKELLDNKENYIGKIATVQFQNYTPAGKLRFPYMKTIRDYE